MSRVLRSLIAVAVMAALAQPAFGQRGASGGRGVNPTRPNNPARVQAPKQDTTKKTPPAVTLDFQDQDLKVVLDAIAAAGDLNVSLTNIPQQRVTIRLGKPVSRDQLGELLRTYAESQGLKVTQSPTLMQISGPEPVRQQPNQSLAQQLLQQNQQAQVRLFTYRLKHASAVQIAPVLSSVFSGFAGGPVRTTTTVLPNATGGFNVIGGQIQSPAQPPGNITVPQPGRGGGGGRGQEGGGGGGGRGQAIGALNEVLRGLETGLRQATGSLSSQASDIRIIADEGSNSLLIRATDSDYQLITQVLQGIDLRPLQVLIEVTIAEVQRTHDLDLGVSGQVKRVPTDKSATVTGTAGSTASARDFILQLSNNNGTIKYDVAIAALQARGDVRVLSLPVIIAQNNRQAVLNVGSSRPFVQVSQTVPNDPTGRVQTVQYIDVGTVLTITPTINPDGYVNLQISQTDNSATNQVQFDAPIINKREATTQVFIRDGQTTVIGGLADNSRSREESGIPFLSRIPWIGPLIFGRQTRTDETRELFLFLTPHIISSDEDIDRYREAVREGSDLLKQLNIGPRIIPRADQC
jgi:type II secretion system protein D